MALQGVCGLMPWPHQLAVLTADLPWWQPYHVIGQKAVHGVLAGETVWRSLNAALPALAVPVGFVPQDTLPAGDPYEAFIYKTKQVPTRCGAHDFFNGLMWAHWPQTKAALNALQWQDISRNGVQATRGAFRDALTLLDENGGLLIAPDPIWAALTRRDWVTALFTLRPLWAAARLWVFGHALLEQLLLFPRKNLTAHLWLPTPAFQQSVDVDQPLSTIDRLWATALTEDTALASKPFTPLPVMGTPGWDVGNMDASYYADTRIFRPLRAGQKAPHRVSHIATT